MLTTEITAACDTCHDLFTVFGEYRHGQVHWQGPQFNPVLVEGRIVLVHTPRFGCGGHLRLLGPRQADLSARPSIS